jgi:NAD(P)H dehydrogenase (quinone)
MPVSVERCIVIMVLIIGLNMLLITGASGRVARRAAALLTQRGYGLRLMTRTPQQVPKLDGAAVVRGDFAEPATLDVAFAGVSAALVVSGSGKPGERARLHRNAFEAAVRAGVKHVVYLSLQGASPSSKYPYSRDHSLSEQYLAATGISYTVLRNAFYLDMFLDKFDAEGVMRGPANETRGAFVSREDAARTAAAVLIDPPGGTHDVTGPEALGLADVARRLAAMTGRQLRYQSETAEFARERLSKQEAASWRVAISVGWFEAIAAGELDHTSDAVFRFTGKKPMGLEEYFTLFPELLQPLRLGS